MDEVLGARPHRPHLDPGRPIRLGRAGSAGATAGDGAWHQRFRTATADLRLLAPAHEAEPLEELATAPIRSWRRVPYASNAVYILELDAADPSLGRRPMRAVYKPARGERPLWDFPHRTLHLRERAAYLLSSALGFGIVPPTILRDGPLGPGSVQLFVTARKGSLGEEAAAHVETQLRRVAAFDVLANNADRKSAHLLLDGSGHLWGIDNALTFLPYPRQRTVLLQLGGSELDGADMKAVRRLRDRPERALLRGALCRLLSGPEVDAFEARLEELATHPWYPRLDDWDGRPFEWW
ncbi:MAG TPA: hypothetical protein VEK76_09365 [Candidatus Binatia bacterium]|nr:hypothetical protein [Candidatus Binatia bacterium]